MSPTTFHEINEEACIEEAKAIVDRQFTVQGVSARMCPEPGMYSRTVIVKLSDDTEVVVQFKDNDIDLTKVALARGLLGDIIPSMYRGKTNQSYFAYISTVIPGEIWNAMKLSDAQEIRVAGQLGPLLATCSLNTPSAAIVDGYVLPRLQRILEREIKSTKAGLGIRSRIERLCNDISQLKALPLALMHIDLNQRNIILDENATIVGLIDWEQAVLAPLGMNAWSIHNLSSVNIRKVDHYLDRTVPMAEAFWRGFISHLPPHLQVLERNMITAMQVGYVFMSAYFELPAPGLKAEAGFVTRFDWYEDTFGPMCTNA